jgi:hypothetical protein
MKRIIKIESNEPEPTPEEVEALLAKYAAELSKWRKARDEYRHEAVLYIPFPVNPEDEN